MIDSALLEQIEDYVERHCFDKKWIGYLQSHGKTFDPHKVESLKKLVKEIEGDEGRTPENDKYLADAVKAVQGGLFYAELGTSPLPVTYNERTKSFATRRNYFANYLFVLMEQKI